VLIRYAKILQQLSYLSTPTARTNVYNYSVSLMIQTYKIFKITVLCNDQNSKGYAKVQTFHTSVRAKSLTRFKILITCRNNVLLKYERRLRKTTVARNYTEVRTISLLGEVRGASEHSLCTVT
jgi:hypothetical protein